MKIGVTLSESARVADEAKQAEEMGFDYVATGEHVFFHGPTQNSLVSLAGAAGATSRIGLVSSVTLVPLYPAALLAKMVAELVSLSDGRFILGVGAGGEYEPEFRACGVPAGRRLTQLTQSLEVVQALLRGERVTRTTDRFDIRDMRLDPVPAAAPPMWVGGRGRAAMRRAARFADVWIPYMYTPERLASSLANVRQQALRFGRTEDAVVGGIFAWGLVLSDGDEARRVATEFVSQMYKQDFSSHAHKYLVAGTPREVAARIAEYRDAGADHVIFAIASGPEHQAECRHLLGHNVRPVLLD